MPFLIENIISTVIWLIVIGVIVIAGFVISAIQRRVRRERFFRELDAARVRAQHALDAVYAEPGKLTELLPQLRSFRTPPERRALEEVLLDRRPPGSDPAVAREVVVRLGWVKEWIDMVRCRTEIKPGRVQELLKELGDHYTPPIGPQRLRLLLKANFLERCAAAKRLSQVPTPEGLIALLAGTHDPHPEVQEVCVQRLGLTGDPVTMPVLIEELIEVLDGKSPLSVRTLKTALVRFALEEMDALRDALVHRNRRVRFFATDIVREVAARRAEREQLGKNDFSPEIYRLFTERLYQDENDDVRARAAPVLAHFYDSVSAQLLTQLMEDPAWFVRLHTCRGVTSKFYIGMVPALAKRLTDSHWLVREAAVQSLMQMGDTGIDEIFRSFLSIRDAYGAEQIAEAMQRDGILVAMLSNISQISSDEDYQRARTVTRRLVQLGKTTLLQAYLVVPAPRRLKLMLIEELSGVVTASYLETLRTCAQQDTDPDVRMAATSVFQSHSAILSRQQ